MGAPLSLFALPPFGHLERGVVENRLLGRFHLPVRGFARIANSRPASAFRPNRSDPATFRTRGEGIRGFPNPRCLGYQGDMRILTVTLNPALDLETETPTLVPGQKLRCIEPRRDPGGGGINVARAITLLGGEATAVIAVGGSVGEGLARRLAASGVTVECLPAPGETRENLSVIETETGRQYRFIFPGPDWSAADLNAATQSLSALVRAGDIVVLSGSLPPGAPVEGFVAMARMLVAAGARVVADTSGAALTALAAARLGLAVLRMDSEEAESLFGHPLPTADDSAETAAGLVAEDAAEIVILARGPEGSVLATQSGARWFAPAADVDVVSVTGAGDSFVGGAMLALSLGKPLPEVLQWGCAAASAAVTTEATELCDRATFERLLPLSRARPI